MARRFVVLGLGTFGSGLAERLSGNGCRVTGVDESEKRVAALQHLLYEAIVADVTSRETLEQLQLDKAETVFISLGEQIERSVLAALHAKEVGARQICVKGVSLDHSKILRALGVHRVVFPEAEMAIQVADEFTWPNVLKGVQLDPEYMVVEMAVPASLVGKSLVEADLRNRFGVMVMAVKDALTGTLTPIPPGSFKLTDEQLLFLMGKEEALSKFRDAG
jgi:trk system potassium uptake protein TrkA